MKINKMISERLKSKEQVTNEEEEGKEVIDRLSDKYDSIRDFAISFFYYFWNVKGYNTEEGFQDFIETVEGSQKLKKLVSTI